MEIGSPKEAPNRLREERMKRHWRQRDVADHLGTTVVTIRRWERGKQHPHAYYLLKLCTLFGKSAEELGLSSTNASAEPDVPPETPEETCTDVAEEKTLIVWSVPYARNPYFTGRESL